MVKGAGYGSVMVAHSFPSVEVRVFPDTMNCWTGEEALHHASWREAPGRITACVLRTRANKNREKQTQDFDMIL